MKTIALAHAGQVVRGEAVVTRDGLEGGAVYALSARLRETLRRDGSALLKLSLRPDLDQAALLARLARPRGKQSLSNFLRKALGLSPVSIGLIREAAIAANVELTKMPAQALATLVNDLSVRLIGIRGIERAISTAGGVGFAALDEHFMLRRKPGVFVAGEMLD